MGKSIEMKIKYVPKAASLKQDSVSPLLIEPKTATLVKGDLTETSETKELTSLFDSDQEHQENISNSSSDSERTHYTHPSVPHAICVEIAHKRKSEVLALTSQIYFSQVGEERNE